MLDVIKTILIGIVALSLLVTPMLLSIVIGYVLGRLFFS